MLNLKDFLDNPKKKIIIDSNLIDCNDVIKSFSLNYKKSYFNYEIHTIISLAKSIVYSKEDINYISNETSLFLLYSFLSNKRNGKDLYNLIPDSSFNLESIKVSLKTINDIRKGKRIEGSINKNVDSLIKEYEVYLIKSSYYDEPLFLNKAIEVVNNLDKEELKGILKISDSYDIGVFNNCLNKLTYLERLFIEQLSKKLNISINVLNIYENSNSSLSSYKTHGFYQEVENIVNLIDKNKIPINEIEIIVSNNSYSNIIKSYFDNYKIPYYFDYGISIKCFDAYSLLSTIIDFYKNHYSIKILNDIYRNNTLKDEYKNFSQLQRLHADKNDIKGVLDRCKKDTIWNASQKDFLYSLIDLDSSKNIYDLYNNLLNIIKKYCKEESLDIVYEYLINKKTIFDLCSSLNIDINSFDLIKKTLDDCFVKVKPSNNNYIVIRKLSSVYNLTKKYVFFLGLSASQLKQNEVESPLLSDDEIKKLIDTKNYYVDLSSEHNNRFNNKLNELIQFNNSKNIYLSYSNYDSCEFKSLSPSTFYSNHLTKELDPLIESKLSFNINQSNDDEKILEEVAFNKIKNDLKFSPTELNTLYNCPISYLYSKYYDQIELNEYENVWLAPNEKGSLVHCILENYYKEHKDKQYDENSFDSIFDNLTNIEKQKHPFDNQKQVDSELKEIKNLTNRYIKSANNDSFRILDCEIKFEDIKIKLNDKTYLFRGKVDRVDYCINSVTNCLNVRVYDYKTGKEKTLKEDGLTQSFIYIEAIKEHLKKSEVKSIIGDFDINNVRYEFAYIYLYSNDEIEFIQSDESDINKASNADKLKSYDELTNSFNSFFDLYNPKIIKSTDFNGGKCGFCKYASKCCLKKRLGMNMVWSNK